MKIVFGLVIVAFLATPALADSPAGFQFGIPILPFLNFNIGPAIGLGPDNPPVHIGGNDEKQTTDTEKTPADQPAKKPIDHSKGHIQDGVWVED